MNLRSMKSTALKVIYCSQLIFSQVLSLISGSLAATREFARKWTRLRHSTVYVDRSLKTNAIRWVTYLASFLSVPLFAQTWSHIQGISAANASNVTSLTLTLPNNPGPGHGVVVGIEFDCCASVPVSHVTVWDANGNTYTMSPHSPFLSPDTSNTASIYFFYLLNAPSNASQTLYINWTTAIDAVAWADEFSSSSGTSAFDIDIGAINTFPSPTINFPSATPAGSNELLYALAFPGNVLTAPATGASAGPWTGAAGGIDSTATGGAAEYDLSASSTTAPSFTDSIAGDSAGVAMLAISPMPGISTPALGLSAGAGVGRSYPRDFAGAAVSDAGSKQLWKPVAARYRQRQRPVRMGNSVRHRIECGGYTVSSVSYWVGSPTSTSFDLGVYADSSGSPASLLCHASTGTISPSAGWNSINISSCPTLSAGTTYWVGYITGSNLIQQGTAPGACPGYIAQ